MINFTKMHGLGNDFVIIEDCEELPQNKYEFARNVCNRHTGIGADGLILVRKGSVEDEFDALIEIFNSDGSEASMCGNGVRCVSKYLIDNGMILKDKTLKICTKSGIKHIKCETINDFIANVDMGVPTFSTDMMPIRTDKAVIYNEPFKTSKGTFNITCVYVGNTHTVIFVNSLFLTPMEEIYLELQKTSKFYDGTNVEFVEIMGNSKIKVCVFERGCGRTLACGSGAVAAAFAAIKIHNLLPIVTVEMEGGNLTVSLDSSTGHIFLSGTAKTVFKGQILI